MAGTNVDQESIREMLTCVICMEEFRSPRSLPCLHTFCQTCLGDYLVRKKVRPGTSFACPTCREAVVLPRNGVKGLRSNFLIQSMLGLLETKEEPETDLAFTEDLLNLDDDVGTEAIGPKGEEDEKNKRLSKTTLLMYQAKEESLKFAIGKANKHIETLKQYITKVESNMKDSTAAKEKILENIRDRFLKLKDEAEDYEKKLSEEVEQQMDIETEAKPFKDEVAFVEEELATLQSVLQFSEDVLSSGSLETIAAVAEDVVTNVNKIAQRELKQPEFKHLELEIPETNLENQLPILIGSLKNVTTRQDSQVYTGECNESSSVSVPELSEEPSVRRPKMSTASIDSSHAASVHKDPNEIRIYPKYLADEFLVGATEGPEVPTPVTEGWRGSPLSLAGFDDEPRANPPIPPRNEIPSTPETASPNGHGRTRREKEQQVKARGSPSSSSDPSKSHKGNRPVVKKTSTAKVFRVMLKLPPAEITAVHIATLTTPLDNIHDIAITKDGDICAVGQTSTKEATFQTVAIYKSSGAQKTLKRLFPFEPAYNGTIGFAFLTYKGKECIALPLPEDSRMRIIPLDDPENMESARSVFYKFKNMLYRPFLVSHFNGKLWAFGLDSFGRDSYDSRNKFDEWHPQSRVWDIETVETSEGPVKPEMVLIPSALQPACATIEESTGTMYLCEKDTISAVRLSDRGLLLWKFGETPKKKQKLKQPQGLCVDTVSGRVFVACHGGDKIVAISTQGQFLQTVVSDKQGIKKPTAVTIDPAGQLLVAQANGQIKVYRMTT